MKTLPAVLVSGTITAFFIACCHWQNIRMLQEMAECKAPRMTIEEFFLPMVTGFLLLGYRHSLRHATPWNSLPRPGLVTAFWLISACICWGLFGSALAQGYPVILGKNLEAFAGLANGDVPAADAMGHIGGLWIAVVIVWLPVAGLLSLVALLPRRENREIQVTALHPPGI